MGFKGTRSYSTGELIAYIESLGGQYGADLNASTGLLETVYKLCVPLNGPHAEEQLEQALQVMGLLHLIMIIG
jgi:zinc protease